MSVADQYEIIKKLGDGGMGSVYLATDKLLGRSVAIKQLHRSIKTDETMDERFRLEARSLAQLNHPNITQLYSYVPTQDEYWMVMEYVEGQSLEDMLKTYPRLDADLAINITIQILEGLKHAHSKGIIHRDIKPANIMFTRDGQIKIMDFGIARMKDSRRMTRAGKTVGTLDFMAPEQIQGSEGDERTDIYATGTMLYLMLSGKLPYENDKEYDLMSMKLRQKPAPLPSDGSPITKSLQKIISHSLEKEPSRRFENTAAFAAQLRSIKGTHLLKEKELSAAIKSAGTLPHNRYKSTLSLNELLSRAAAIGNTMGGTIIAKKHRPYLLLGLSAILSLVIIFFATSDEDAAKPQTVQNTPSENNAVAMNSPETNVSASSSLPPPEVVDFDESPNERLKRIQGEAGGGSDKAETPKKQDPKQPVKNTPVIPTAPRESPRPAPEKEEEAAPRRDTRPVDVPAGKVVGARLMERISSEDRSRDGENIILQTTEQVEAGGKVIIREGAKVIGKIVDVVSSTDKRRKAVVGIVIREVQAVDGQMLRVGSERYRKFAANTGETVSFDPGDNFNFKLGRGRVE